MLLYNVFNCFELNCNNITKFYSQNFDNLIFKNFLLIGNKSARGRLRALGVGSFDSGRLAESIDVSHVLLCSAKGNCSSTGGNASPTKNIFPCFDQPDLKALFEIIMQHKRGYNALTNFPFINSKYKFEWAGLWYLSYFETSQIKLVSI